MFNHAVATVLTVYGIETQRNLDYLHSQHKLLQQCLPFTVLKPFLIWFLTASASILLQQCLPFTVLKRMVQIPIRHPIVATVLTVYGIETTEPLMMVIRHTSCNSAYRLRY